MENIYKHNVTADELKKLHKLIPGRRIDDKEDYEKKTDDEVGYADLFRLYSLRGEKDKAQFFLDKIEDQVLKFLLD